VPEQREREKKTVVAVVPLERKEVAALQSLFQT
jgi:hypothetical protein